MAVPRLQFAKLAVQKSNEFVADIEAQLPRVEELKKMLSLLTAEARAKGVTLDDEASAKDPVVADLRARIDPVVEEIIRMQNDIEQRAAINQQIRDVLQGGGETSGSLEVPISLAAMMLNIKIPG
tara:strand:+ start:138 stop:512 length:375 start_codon:yes stop_codon:yes gene_type:complete